MKRPQIDFYGFLKMNFMEAKQVFFSDRTKRKKRFQKNLFVIALFLYII